MNKLMKRTSHLKNLGNSGFTLIELLVVIALIGILAGVLVTTIDPVKQQNRSRNASIKSSLAKAGHAVNVTKAATGSLPSGTQLGQELENIYYDSSYTNCTSSTLLDCRFSVSGTSLPKNCGSDAVIPTSTGTSQCFMRIVSYGTSSGGNLPAGKFRIVAAKFPLNTSATTRRSTYELYVFDSRLGLLECGTGISYTGTSDLSVVNPPHGTNNCSQVAEQ